MDNRKNIRIGIIGAGSIVKQRHLPGLGKIPGVEVSVVCNRSKESARQVSSEFGIHEVVEGWENVVSRNDLDVIWIGTTPNLHAEISIAALESGKHVFCQARMAMNLAQARQMVKAAQEHPDQIAMLCPPPNGMKHGKFFSKLIHDQIIGEIMHFHLNSLNSSWADPAVPAHWRQRIEMSGNNVLSLGIYAEVLGYFLGDPLSICAQGNVVISERQGYQVKIPDYIQVLGSWPGDINGVMEWSGLAQFAPKDSLQLYGTEGTLIYDFASDAILLGKRGDENLQELKIPDEFVKRWVVEEEFINAVRNGGSPEPSFNTGLRYMRFVEAVHLSIVEKRWIELSTL